MAMTKKSFAGPFFVTLLSYLATSCASLSRSRPVEAPAEIMLPASNTPGGLTQIRHDLLRFSKGDLHPHTRTATCKQCVVDVEIQAIGLTTDIVPLDGPARFRIIGRVLNKDPRDTEDQYGLKPGTEYLIWVEPAPLNGAGTSRTRWGFLELAPGPTGPIVLQTIGYVERCDHPYTEPPWKSDTDFKDCADAAMRHTGSALKPEAVLVSSLASSEKPRKALYAVGAGWFDCGGYCCTGTSRLF